MIYTRFIACGDSFTEGMTDDFVEGQYRGWADRVADILASGSPDFTYANLAIRGKLVRQVVSDQVPVAMTFVTGKETVVSFHAGANDVLRPNYKQEIVLPLYAQAVRDLAASGATVLLFTVLERTGNTG
ncbi:MAG: SGNH/GDSL hydrolase family protein, partial [Actinobacteria bacterium]|nr:SGNH/GDSL hydrolase family protein [Actinomycetota bacterium]